MHDYGEVIMKKFLVLILLILVIILSGCSSVSNLRNFNLPDDLEFLELVESLDTPEKICNYMRENFIYKAHCFYAPDPYTLWKIKEGDCNDFADFARFIANYHGYETYGILICFKDTFIRHVLAVFVENNKLTYLDNKAYYPIYVDTFEEIVSYCISYTTEYEYKSYKVYDYENNLIEVGN